MKTQNIKKLTVLAILGSAIAVSGCSMAQKENGATTQASTIGGGGGGGGGGTTAVASFSSTVPTADSMVYRIENALTLPGATTSLVNPLAGNFKTALGQQLSNLSTTSDPATATGSASVPLLVYAACNDVKGTSYTGVTTSTTSTTVSAAESTALINAGITIVNQCTGGLAAAGTTLNTQVSSIFSTLVSSDTSSGGTTSQDFISVCTAAASFCVSMLGF